MFLNAKNTLDKINTDLSSGALTMGEMVSTMGTLNDKAVKLAASLAAAIERQDRKISELGNPRDNEEDNTQANKGHAGQHSTIPSSFTPSQQRLPKGFIE